MKYSGIVFLVLLMAINLCGCRIRYNPSGAPLKDEASDKIVESTPEVTDEELLEKAEKARIANPWGETQSLSVAEEWAGLSFTPLEEEIKLEDTTLIRLTTYRYMEGTIEALYADEDYKLIVKKSNDKQGLELAGDYDPYPSETEENIEGLTVHCFGDGETINLAYYDTADGHFSVSFHREGEGLTKADLSGIIKRK